MEYKAIKSSIKDLKSKEGLSYAVAELSGGLTSFAVGTYATTFFDGIDWSDEANALCTLVVKSISFAVANISSHRTCYNLLNKGEPYPGHYLPKLLKANYKGSKIFVGLGMLSHLAVLKTGIVPVYLSVLVGYTVPGAIGSFFRHKHNFEEGVPYKKEPGVSKESTVPGDTLVTKSSDVAKSGLEGLI